MKDKKILFVTVGSTGFDKLIETVLSNESLEILRSKGFNKLIVQYGKSKNTFQNSLLKNRENNSKDEFQIIGYDYKPSIHHDMKNANLIICHSGNHSDYI